MILRFFSIALLFFGHFSCIYCETVAYFSPKDHIAEKLIDLIDREKGSVQVAIYCLTHREISNALIAARKRGVVVEIVVDPFSVKCRSPLAKMVKEGISIWVWDAPPKYYANSNRPRRALMHDKFAIFGGKLLWTGSFNFTYEADRSHQENVILLDDPAIIRLFQEQFTTLKLKGTLPYTDYIALQPKKKKN